MGGHIWIGTSGYSYPHWVGTFYPEAVPQDEWLAYYSAKLDAVEINTTFYGLPKRETFEHWAAQTPADFRFVLKGSRYLTHVRKLKDPADPIGRLMAAAEPLGSRLEGVLWQLPGRWRADAGRLRGFLAALAANERSAGLRHAFEFRDPSWFAPAIYEALAELGAAVVITDWPLRVLGPGMRARHGGPEAVHVPYTSDWMYVRRHGPGARYQGGYTRSMLAAEARRLRGWAAAGKDAMVFIGKEGLPESRGRSAQGSDAYVFFNNDAWGYAARDARRLKAMLGAMG